MLLVNSYRYGPIQQKYNLQHCIHRVAVALLQAHCVHVHGEMQALSKI